MVSPEPAAFPFLASGHWPLLEPRLRCSLGDTHVPYELGWTDLTGSHHLSSVPFFSLVVLFGKKTRELSGLAFSGHVSNLVSFPGKCRGGARVCVSLELLVVPAL